MFCYAVSIHTVSLDLLKVRMFLSILIILVMQHIFQLEQMKYESLSQYRPGGGYFSRPEITVHLCARNFS